MAFSSAYIPASLLLEDIGIWPSDLAEIDGGLSVLDRIGVRDTGITETESQVTARFTVVFEDELSLTLPGLSEISLVFGSTGDQSEFAVEVDVRDPFEVRLVDISAALRFSAGILKAVRQTNGSFEVDDSAPHVEIKISGTVIVGSEGFRIDGLNQFTLAPCMIGNSGVVIEASNVVLDLDRDSSIAEAQTAGLPASWTGVFIQEAAIHLPAALSSILPDELRFENCFIGSGGFSGRVEAAWDPPATGNLAGMELGLRSFGLEFRQNSLVRSEITGQVTLPFFDAPLDVEIGLNLDGGFSIRLSSETGISTLTIPNVADVEVDSLGLAIEQGVFTAKISGSITPLLGAPSLDWPTLEVKELSIDSEGNVRLDGGWIDLPSQYGLEFYGFQIEITRLGFGKTEDGGKWIGFSGALKLVDGFTAGASVEGLRIIWYDDERDARITLEGVGVEFEVPEVLRFKGAVSYRELQVINDAGEAEEVHRFDGAIKLELTALNLELDGTLVVGSAEGPQGRYNFFAVYLGVELPAGIPLWATGLGLYGIAGLFANQMEPDKHQDEQWYSLDIAKSWYHRGTPGITDLNAKWVNRRGSLAFGAGLTIGTLADNGFVLSTRALLVIVFPGPIILIEGRANLLRERASLNDEPLFRALAVIDGREGSFLFGLDATYAFGSGGELIDISAGAEAFFSLSDPGAWHLYIGEREPREKRIRASIFFHIFEANAYFMLDSRQLAMGAWVGYSLDWEFGPVRAILEAWVEGNVIVSWKPVHLHGDYWVHGKAELTVFGIGFGFGIDVKLAADVFDPFHLLAELGLEIITPWPFPNVDVTITLEWGPEPIPPLLPEPLKEIAVEHLKVTTSWPLRRGELLLPVYDADADGYLDDSDRDGVLNGPTGASEPPNFNALPPSLNPLPVVPLDCRPHITFGRSVNDDAGVSPQPLNPEWERIGDPAKNEGPVRVRFGLKQVALDKWNEGTNSWLTVAAKPVPPPAPLPAIEVRPLYGSWAPIPAMPDGGGTATSLVKLWLWSKNSFEYTRHSATEWNESFTDRFTNYPCIPPATDTTLCFDFEAIDSTYELRSPWQSPEEPFFIFSWLAPAVQQVTVLNQPIDGLTHALCFPSHTRDDPPMQNNVTIELPQPARQVLLTLFDQEQVTAFGFDQQGQSVGPFVGGTPGNPHLEINGQNLVRVLLRGSSQMCILKVCAIIAPSLAEAARREEMAQILRDEMVHWYHQDNVLEPHTIYRLSVTTSLRAEGEGELQGYTVPPNSPPQTLDQTHFAYFRTEGPPGLTHLSLPPGQSGQLVYNAGTISVTSGSPTVWGTNTEWTDDLVGAVLQVSGESTAYTIDSVALQGHLSLSRNYAGQTQSGVTYSINRFDSGLEDLTGYVRQTVPPTVPPEGEQPLLPRPVYRAYDVGVEFNENYVDLMYRLSRRDLGLYLYDNNNRPVRDAAGRLIVLSNRWGVTEELVLTEGERFQIRAVNSQTCAELRAEDVSRDVTLTSSSEGQVLEADTVYEGRLVPLLLHEGFASFTAGASANGPSSMLEQWMISDDVTSSSPSHWEIREEALPDPALPPARYGIQTSNIGAGSTTASDPSKPGTIMWWVGSASVALAHPENPVNWTDYRVSVFLRATDEFTTDCHAMGLMFRMFHRESYYRFSMDRDLKYRRLVRVVDDVHTILSEDDFVYQKNVDYLITIEAIGPSLRVYQDGRLVFDVNDEAIATGTIGLYCWRNPGTRFSHIRVDDFRGEAPAVYSFEFTTSQYANFYHHLHSFQDETWRGSLPAALDLAVTVPLSNITTPPEEAEARAFESAVGSILGQAARQNASQVEVTRVMNAEATGDDQAVAFLVRGPEPVDWSRIELNLSRADRRLPAALPPGEIKLTEVTFGETAPNQESVTLVLREALDPSGYSIQYQKLPGPIAELTDDGVLFVDEFEDARRGLLFLEEFGPNALDHYEIVDEVVFAGGSQWSVAGGHIVQTSGIFGGVAFGQPADRPGTLALTGLPSWSNVRISATLRSDDYGSIGLVFRYRDRDDYYRFSMHRERPPTTPFTIPGQSYRRLIKSSGSTVQTLWEDDFVPALNTSYRLVIESFGEWLVGYLDGMLIFSVRDSEGAIAAGRVGFYCWRNPGAHFEALKVESMEVAPVLWQPAFQDLSELEVIDEAGAVFGPSQWAATNGVLTQSSNIHVIDNTYHVPGTYVVGGQSDWRDVEISVRLGSDDGDAIGVMFRYQDGGNYYRFSMDRQRSYRRLVKVLNGAATRLWEDPARYTVGQTYNLTLRAVGSEMTGYLDGVQMFQIIDDSLRRGRVALYCWADFGARFERLVVLDRTRRIGQWVIRDDVGANVLGAPSIWKISNGALQQTSPINGYAHPTGNLRVGDPLGTYAITGEQPWTDYRLTARMRSDDNYAIGMVFRYTDEGNFYRLSFDVNAPYRRLIKREDGVLDELWLELGNSYTLGEPFTMTVDVIGSRIIGYVGDTRIVERTDGTHATGRIGLYCYANEGARFERVEVRRLPLEAYVLLRDRFLDGDLTGWTEEREGNRGVARWSVVDGELQQTGDIHTPNSPGDALSFLGTQMVAGDPAWTDLILTARVSSRDGGPIGVMLRYVDSNNYYRFSMNNRDGVRLLVKKVDGRFSLLWSEMVGYEIDRNYEVAITVTGNLLRGHIDGVPMFVVEDQDLTAGRVGLYCSANREARFSHVRIYPAELAFNDWLLEDPFDALIPRRWTFVDETALAPPLIPGGPFRPGDLIPIGGSSSHWEVIDGEMRQTSDYYAGSVDRAEPEKPGTYAVAGAASWADYRFSARLRSDTDNGIGVVFRYRDRDNYYRFSMDEQLGYRRLIKKVDGRVSVLWESSLGYDHRLEQIITIDCEGDRLSGYLNGVQLFSVEDDDIQAGRVGLYSWRNEGARFLEVRVAPAVWVPLYTFGREEPMPAGTRVRVFSGNRIDQYEEERGVRARFAASFGERGSLNLGSDYADLRLVAPDRSVVHRRAFFPNDRYSRVSDVLAQRKADGTGFFLMKRDGGGFEEGQYRLQITYRRENLAVDPESPVLSEAGDRGPEVVSIHIP